MDQYHRFLFLYARRYPVKKGISLALVLFALLTSCGVELEIPEGFALVEKSPEYTLVVSPEGLKMRIRTTKNYPVKDLAFWKEALETQLEQEGYVPVGKPRDFQAGGNEGVVFQWGVPYRGENYIFLTAVLVDRNTIIIAEAAGRKDIFDRYRESIVESLSTIRQR